MSDDAMARLDARLERVEATLEKVVTLVSKVAEASLHGAGTPPADTEARLAAIEASVAKMDAWAVQVEDTFAMGMDVADEWVAERVGGDEADTRMKVGVDTLLTLTRPDVLTALAHLADRAPQLTRLADLGASFDDTVAMGADVMDAWIADTIGGDGLTERVAAGQHAAEVLTRPETLQALTRLAAMAPQLETVATLAAGFEDTVAMAADVFDDFVRTQIGGDSLGERMSAAAAVLLQVSDPEVLASVAEITALAPQLKKTAHLAAELDDLVDVMGNALRVEAQPVGPIGAFFAMRDPDVQQGIGQAIQIAKHLGRNHTYLPVKH